MKRGVMRETTAILGAVLLFTGVSATDVRAEDDNGLKISGFVDASIVDAEYSNSSFGLDQVEIDIEKKIDDRLSARLDVNYLPKSDDPATAGNDESKQEFDDLVEQGYVTYSALDALTLTFGKFNAPIGFELLDPVDMYQYSHALVFDFGLPTNLTGLMGAYAFSDMFDVSLYVVNGWDNNYDDNTDKHVGTRIGITSGKMLNLGLSYISGNINLTPTKKVSQTITDIDLTYTPTERFTLGAEYNMGKVKEASNVTAGDASWSGYLVMAHYDFNDTYGLTLRYDTFNDEDDYAINAGFGKEKRTAMTAAVTFGIADGLGGLVEWKNTKSDVKVFTDKDGNPKDSESTLAAELTFSF